MAGLHECRTLADLLRRQARLRPDATALVFEDRTASYRELDRRANRIANGLVALGVRGGDRIGYLGKNSDRYFELLFGAAKAGAVLVPLNSRLAPPEIEAILEHAEIGVLFVGRGFDPVVGALALPGQACCISMEGGGEAWPDFEQWRDAQVADEPAVEIDPNATALLMYTSGTTGLPKGVELTNRNVVAFFAAAQAGGYGDVAPEDVVLVCMPIFHVAGTNVGLLSLAHGCTAIVKEEADAAGIIDSIRRWRVTWVLLVPAVVLMVVQHPGVAASDVRSVRKLVYGASPIAEDLVRQARALFGGAGLWHLYGLTEATGAGTISPPEAHEPAAGKLRSCGRPYPGLELRIVDPSGVPVASGEVGEIVIRGPTLMKGYWNNPRATREAFLEGGWLRTGDAAYMDADGFVYVHDRVKDMIVTGAENVYPAEVENALFGHPAIVDVAVIGVPDPRWGEAVKAIAVLRPGSQASAEDIVAYARERIAGYKLPKSVDFVAALPRNPTGKVLRRELRAPYWAGRDRQVG